MNRARVVVLAGLSLLFAVQADDDEAVIRRGHDVFQHWCTPCHGAGPDHPGTDALAAKYQGKKPAPLEERTDLTPDLTRQFVRTGVSIMPFFRKTEISDADLDARAAYLAPENR
ncbi:MAG: c-type cytochrome [Gammaproteobacteria bacterium]